mgnify:CR=1 FL=1
MIDDPEAAINHVDIRNPWSSTSIQLSGYCPCKLVASDLPAKAVKVGGNSCNKGTCQCVSLQEASVKLSLGVAKHPDLSLVGVKFGSP